MEHVSPDTKFLHFRFSDDRGEIRARGGLTIAYRTTPEGKLLHTYAKCHQNDNFNKRLGRIKAGGRLKSQKWAREFNGTEDQFVEAVQADVESYSAMAEQIYGLRLARKFNGKRRGS